MNGTDDLYLAWCSSRTRPEFDPSCVPLATLGHAGVTPKEAMLQA